MDSRGGETELARLRDLRVADFVSAEAGEASGGGGGVGSDDSEDDAGGGAAGGGSFFRPSAPRQRGALLGPRQNPPDAGAPAAGGRGGRQRADGETPVDAFIEHTGWVVWGGTLRLVSACVFLERGYTL